MNHTFQQKPIPQIKIIIAIGSGKGGVGKSTVSANLALALRQEGWSVGLLDADIYGPSLPRLMGLSKQRPELDEKTKKIHPIRKLGIQVMSMGFLVEEDLPVIWRGPMLFKAIQQFFFDVLWENLDCLVVDLPPGTGDVALTMAQKIPVDGAIVVCTPQNLALLDAKKAMAMFEKVRVPLLGVVENMSEYFHPKDKDHAPLYLFPKGDLDLFIRMKGIHKLASIPFHPNVGLSSEAGLPIIESDPHSLEAKGFKKIAKYLMAHFLKEKKSKEGDMEVKKESQLVRENYHNKKEEPEKELN